MLRVRGRSCDWLDSRNRPNGNGGRQPDHRAKILGRLKELEE